MLFLVLCSFLVCIVLPFCFCVCVRFHVLFELSFCLFCVCVAPRSRFTLQPSLCACVIDVCCLLCFFVSFCIMLCSFPFFVVLHFPVCLCYCCFCLMCFVFNMKCVVFVSCVLVLPFVCD